jgi:hypothetical protein
MEKLNQWLTLAANFGVIAGLIFLGLEIQQNTISTRMAARENATQGHIDYLGYLLDNTVLARANEKLTNNQPVDDLEDNQMRIFLQMRWRHYERVYYQYRNDLISDQEWAGFEAGIMRSFREENDLWRMSGNVWARDKERLSQQFAEYVEGLRVQQE